MGRKKVADHLRCITASVSMPRFLWELHSKHGSKYIVGLIKRGKWALDNNVNEMTIIAIKKKYEGKIMKLQEIIDGRH